MEREEWHGTREIGRVQYALSRGVLALGVPLLSSGIIYQLFFTSENIWAFLGFLVPMIPGTLWFGFRFGAKKWDANERRCSKTGPSLLELPDPPRPDRLIAACGKVSLVIGIILAASFAITYAFTAAAQDADMANNLKLRTVGGYVVLGNLFVSIVAAVIGALPLFAPIKPKETAKIATTLNTAISIVVIILFVTRYNRDTADTAQESLAYSESASAPTPIPQEIAPAFAPSPSPTVEEPAPAAVPQATANALDVAKQEAVRLYPELGIAGSRLNQTFIARYRWYQAYQPDFFYDPNWPVVLVEESVSAIRAADNSSTPAPAIPGLTQ